jgi:hypothetical protein
MNGRHVTYNFLGLLIVALLVAIGITAFSINWWKAKRLRSAALKGELPPLEKQAAFDQLEAWRIFRQRIVWSCIAVGTAILWISRL